MPPSHDKSSKWEPPRSPAAVVFLALYAYTICSDEANVLLIFSSLLFCLGPGTAISIAGPRTECTSAQAMNSRVVAATPAS